MKAIPVQEHQNEILRLNLKTIFGSFDETGLLDIEQKLQWYEIEGGEILFHQHDDADCLYFVISGRLEAYLHYGKHEHLKIGEIIKGETVGEMAIFTGEKRSATIVALRDSVLVKLTTEVFKQTITDYPAVSFNVTTLIIQRLQKMQTKMPFKKPANICVLPLHDSADANGFCKNLYTKLATKGKTLLVEKEEVLQEVHSTEHSATVNNQLLADWFDNKETMNDFLLFKTDETITDWTIRCVRQADLVLLLADATKGPSLTLLDNIKKDNIVHTGSNYSLVMVHPANTLLPEGTNKWLEVRPWVTHHYHIRAGHDADIARLARIFSGRAIGLALAGGGCKGFAHIGVIKALKERNIPIDFVGGTSVGSMVAGCFAFDQSVDNMKKYMREGAMYNPTKDYNPFPIVSIIQGKRMKNMIRNCIYRFTHRYEVDIEDTWITLYVVSTNYTQATEMLHTRGSMHKYIQASTAMPGVFPPVIEGNDLLIDGGTFNNFPADIMHSMGADRVIGIEFGSDKTHLLGTDTMPSAMDLVKDKFRSKKNKKYKVPGLFSILLNAPLLYSYAKRQEAKKYTHLYFNPDVAKFGIVNWKAFDVIMQKGYDHAVEMMNNLGEEEIRKYQS